MVLPIENETVSPISDAVSLQNCQSTRIGLSKAESDFLISRLSLYIVISTFSKWSLSRTVVVLDLPPAFTAVLVRKNGKTLSIPLLPGSSFICSKDGSGAIKSILVFLYTLCEL